MKIKDENRFENANKSDQTAEESQLKSIQNWISNNKLITGIAAVAFVYLVGGRRIRQIASFAVRSGIATGVTNVALSVMGAKSAPNKHEEGVLH